MKVTISWALIIIGIWAFISGLGYFVAIYINHGVIYFDTELMAVAQVIISILLIASGIKNIKSKSNANKA